MQWWCSYTWFRELFWMYQNHKDLFSKFPLCLFYSLSSAPPPDFVHNNSHPTSWCISRGQTNWLGMSFIWIECYFFSSLLKRTKSDIDYLVPQSFGMCDLILKFIIIIASRLVVVIVNEISPWCFDLCQIRLHHWTDGRDHFGPITGRCLHEELLFHLKTPSTDWLVWNDLFRKLQQRSETLNGGWSFIIIIGILKK